jgi:hypothetical protein
MVPTDKGADEKIGWHPILLHNQVFPLTLPVSYLAISEQKIKYGRDHEKK